MEIWNQGNKWVKYWCLEKIPTMSMICSMHISMNNTIIRNCWHAAGQPVMPSPGGLSAVDAPQSRRTKGKAMAMKFLNKIGTKEKFTRSDEDAENASGLRSVHSILCFFMSDLSPARSTGMQAQMSGCSTQSCCFMPSILNQRRVLVPLSL